MKIEKCQDKELITKSKQYFESNKNLNEIFVSPDGQFFATLNKSVYHCLKLRVQALKITRDMIKTSANKKTTEKK